MSNENANEKTANRPTHNLARKIGHGKNTSFEQLGVAWAREEDGGLYCKLYGTQVLKGGFYAFPIKDDAEKENAQ